MGVIQEYEVLHGDFFKGVQRSKISDSGTILKACRYWTILQKPLIMIKFVFGCFFIYIYSSSFLKYLHGNYGLVKVRERSCLWQLNWIMVRQLKSLG